MSHFLYDCAYYYFGGIFAGFAGTLVSQPFDTCKIHLQTQRPMNFASRSFKENILWAYRGALPCVIGYGIEKSLVFGTYSTTCNLLKLDEHNVSHTFFAGLISGLVASISITPAEQLKTDQQLKKSSVYTLQHLYKGFKYTALRESIGFSIYFSAYNQLSKQFNRVETDSFATKIGKSGILGACSAFIAWIPIYPIDLNKTRIQSGDAFNSFITELNAEKGIGKIKFLYRGYHFGMMRAVPFHSTCFMVFEILKSCNKNPYKSEFEL